MEVERGAGREKKRARERKDGGERKTFVWICVFEIKTRTPWIFPHGLICYVDIFFTRVCLSLSCAYSCMAHAGIGTRKRQERDKKETRKRQERDKKQAQERETRKRGIGTRKRPIPACACASTHARHVLMFMVWILSTRDTSLSLMMLTSCSLMMMLTMGWLRLIGSFKLQVSFVKEHYKRDNIL